jgi:hypothetical protein
MCSLIRLAAGVTVRSLLISLMLTSCALGPPLEEQRQFVRSVPVCSTDRECELKWSAARQWVLATAGLKLQYIARDFMGTYNPPRNSSALAVRIVKEPMANGGYQIKVSTWCNNNSGCVPNSWDAAQDFNNYVNSVPTPTATSEPATPGRASPAL